MELRYKSSDCIGCGSCIAACSNSALSAGPDGPVHHAASCKKCGSCVQACPSGAMAFSGKRVSVDQVLAEALADRGMYDRTGGGVTLSGGEASAQYEFALALLDALRQKGIHTALDTCGQCEPKQFETLVGMADMVLYDLKHMSAETHKALTGVDNRLILKNFYTLAGLGVPVEVRVPVIPGYNDDDINLAATARAVREQGHIQRVILLGYHALGLSKIIAFDQHGRNLGITSPSGVRLRSLAEQFENISGVKTIYR